MAIDQPIVILVLLGVAALLPDAGGSWTSALRDSLILGASAFALFLIFSSFGFGDVKLALVLGAVLGWYGWALILIGAFVGYLLFALYAISLILAGRVGRTATIPLGPFLLAGALASVLLGSYAQ